ncbi:hypothetical protein SpCBS45565_g00901 [Spizellomyces sp. 'palustris']|nr:hypothetical protein SpCBS45565_g00901 [Spizellomyces sp. 'palustris']
MSSPSTETPRAPKYIDAEDLASLVRDPTKTPGKDYVVVDVRGEDFGFGNIPGVVNIPSHEFLDHPRDFIEPLNSVPKVIFHCALSQVRGPKCANHYQQVSAVVRGQQEAAKEGEGAPQEVLILRGGFQNWQNLYAKESDLVENYNAQFWKDEL